MNFNPAPPTVMHLDLNSCFASIEQQANPRLRGKPVAVAAYTSPGGCILAASTEAKRLGVKTGMRVREGKALCPDLVVLPSDPDKYRFVNRQLLVLLRQYSSDVEVRSIDEMVLECATSSVFQSLLVLTKFRHGEILSTPQTYYEGTVSAMRHIAVDIKYRIKRDVGEWLTVSIGIAPNRYLAKIASGLHKPDGLDLIDGTNIEAVLSGMQIEDLHGIKEGYSGRLRRFGIHTPLALYEASPSLLKAAFHSILGYHWWLRLHGWGIDERNFATKSIGHSYALYHPYAPSDPKLHQILCQLIEKVGRRLRMQGYRTQGIHVSCLYTDYSCWHKGRKLPQPLYATSDLYQAALTILANALSRPVRILAVTAYYLTADLYQQRSLFKEDTDKERLTQALDTIAERWGEFTVFPGKMLWMEQKVLDRIAFGGVKGLKEVVFRESTTAESYFPA